MSKEKESPETKRERIRQEELKKSASGSMNGGSLPDLVGNLGWKSTGLIIILLIIGFIVYSLFFR